jgi:hypothetical protein
MTRKHANRAIIVLESPWELDDTDANRSSVLPFVEGVAKLTGDMEVLHANYYDEKSFLYAIRCLSKAKYKNAVVYIAAHGGDGEVGNIELLSAFAAVSLVAEDCNITGVLVGSCYGGECLATLKAGIMNSRLRWCAGYASSANWLDGTLIDCSILAEMADLSPAAYKDGGKLIDALTSAISAFSPTFPIGKDADGALVALRDSLQFVIQPDGQGHRARTVSDEVFGRHSLYQLDDEDDEDDE